MPSSQKFSSSPEPVSLRFGSKATPKPSQSPRVRRIIISSAPSHLREHQSCSSFRVSEADIHRRLHYHKRPPPLTRSGDLLSHRPQRRQTIDRCVVEDSVSYFIKHTVSRSLITRHRTATVSATGRIRDPPRIRRRQHSHAGPALALAGRAHQSETP